MATVFIPTPLRKFTGNQARLQMQATDVESLLGLLCTSYPDLKRHITTVDGGIPEFINIFVGNQDIRTLMFEKTPVDETSEVSIIPAIAGGAPAAALFSNEELARYNRHLIIPEFGLQAQARLKKAKVLVVGCGGLGSPLLLYLAAAGVGTIGIIDHDVVDDSNLQRQILYCVQDVGVAKVDAASRRLQGLNPHINFHVHSGSLDQGNAISIISEYDIVADGTDNFPVRYIMNDACVLLGKPIVYASVFQFDGQLSVFNYKDAQGNVGPSYRDLYPSAPPAEVIPRSSEIGVLGVLPGIMGCLQALEVIKVITGTGDILSGRLMTFDALGLNFRFFSISKRINTPVDMGLMQDERVMVNGIVTDFSLPQMTQI
jgi:sulfur-carrier protein adenylyltransferase/sulfurtransferase